MFYPKKKLALFFNICIMLARSLEVIRSLLLRARTFEGDTVRRQPHEEAAEPQVRKFVREHQSEIRLVNITYYCPKQ